jgi:hypothetical protein
MSTTVSVQAAMLVLWVETAGKLIHDLRLYFQAPFWNYCHVLFVWTHVFLTLEKQFARTLHQ